MNPSIAVCLGEGCSCGCCSSMENAFRNTRARIDEQTTNCARGCSMCWAPVEDAFKKCKANIDAQVSSCTEGCSRYLAPLEDAFKMCRTRFNNGTANCTTECASCSQGCFARMRRVHPSTWIAICLLITTAVFASGVAYLLFERFTAEHVDVTCVNWFRSLGGNEIALNICRSTATPPPFDSGLGDEPYTGKPWGYRPGYHG